MTNIQQIAALINQITTLSDLKQVGEVYQAKWRSIQAVEAAKALSGIYHGAPVTFKGKRGETITGKVAKINNKTVKVLTDGGMMWSVSPQLLSIVK